MKRRLCGFVLLGAAILLTTSSAFGGHKRGGDCGPTYGAAYSAYAPCGPAYTITWVEKKVTAYKTEWETKDVKVKVNERVKAKEEYKHPVNESVVTKQKVKVPQLQTKDKPYKYIVNEWVTTKEDYKYIVHEPVVTKQKVKVPQQQTKDEPYKFIVNEWVTTKE